MVMKMVFTKKNTTLRFGIWLWVMTLAWLCIGMENDTESYTVTVTVNTPMEIEYSNEILPWTVTKVPLGSQASFLGIEVGWEMIKWQEIDMTSENAEKMKQLLALSKKVLITFQAKKVKKIFNVGDLLYDTHKDMTHHMYLIEKITADDKFQIRKFDDGNNGPYNLTLTDLKTYFQNFGPVNKAMTENIKLPQAIQLFAKRKMEKIIAQQFRTGDLLYDRKNGLFVKVDAVGKNGIYLINPANQQKFHHWYAAYCSEMYDKIGQKGDLLQYEQLISQNESYSQIYFIEEIQTNKSGIYICNSNLLIAGDYQQQCQWTRYQYPSSFTNYGPVNTFMATSDYYFDTMVKKNVLQFAQKKMNGINHLHAGDVIQKENGELEYIKYLKKNYFGLAAVRHNQQEYNFDLWYAKCNDEVRKVVSRKGAIHQLKCPLLAEEIHDGPNDENIESHILLSNDDDNIPVSFRILDFLYLHDDWYFYVRIRSQVNKKNNLLANKTFKINAHEFLQTTSLTVPSSATSKRKRDQKDNQDEEEKEMISIQFEKVN